MKKLKNIILFFLGLKNGLYYRWLFGYKKIKYASFPKINSRLFVRGNGQIVIGKNINFNSSTMTNPIGGDVRMKLVVGPQGTLTIGDDTGISNSVIVCQNSISIGEYVKIGGGVKIYDTDFHSLDFQKRKNKLNDIPSTKPAKIGDFCFIGAHSIILRGVCIGNKYIIGAGSVVIKSVAENGIWAGNPAKFIKLIS